jgi:acetylornithine/N-succinyldiaminopimelate aminotransferase
MDGILETTRRLDACYVMQTYRRLPVAFVRGRGSRLWDSSGKEYVDMVGGLGVTVLGHCHPAVTEAICEQASKLVHTTNLYYVEPQAALGKVLVERTFPGSRCFFANSGAEANEGALKLARKWHFNRGDARDKVVALLGSFHGRTLATMSATGQPTRWEPFNPVVPGFELNDVEALKKAVDDRTSAVLLEPVLGEGGVHQVDDAFIRAAREACDSTGALLVADEVQSGMGRTGTFYAIERSGVTPDIITLAKGLANGVPAAAFIAASEFGEALVPGEHGTTFGGGFLACAAALVTVNTVLDQKLPDNASRVGEALKDRLTAMATSVPSVTGVRGRGLMLAVQLEGDIAREVVLRSLERGVLFNDVSPGAVRMLPALNISMDEALGAAEKLEQVLLSMT